MAPQAAFTLVEIMVVVTIIGILALMGVPGIRKAADIAEATTTANDLRVFTSAIEIYSGLAGDYPQNMTYNNMPDDVSDSLPASWKNGSYSWFYIHDANYVYIYVYNLSFTPEQAIKTDAILDDGNIGTGNVRMAFNGTGLIYLFELNI